MSDFEVLGGEVEWQGQTMAAGTERYRFADGEQVGWDKVWHPGAVAIIPVHDEHVWLVRQPRPAGGLSAALEIPAGKRDVEGEPPLQTAQRELVEEIGKQARNWRELMNFYVAPGWTDERLWLFLATDLHDAPGGATHLQEERLEIVSWPISKLDDALGETEDAKTLIALQWLQLHADELEAGAASQS